MKYCFYCDELILGRRITTEFEGHEVNAHKRCAKAFNLGRSIEIGEREKGKTYVFGPTCPLCNLDLIKDDYVYEKGGVRYHAFCYQNKRRVQVASSMVCELCEKPIEGKVCGVIYPIGVSGEYYVKLHGHCRNLWLDVKNGQLEKNLEGRLN